MIPPIWRMEGETMSDDKEEVDDSSYEFDRMLRHAGACLESDMQHLRASLVSAADRMADVADMLEKNRDYYTDAVAFLRISARRYRKIAEGQRRKEHRES